MEQLTAGANSAETASKRCQQTLSDVQRLLEPERLTQYKFKKRKSANTFSGAVQSNETKSPPLSSFAKMVFQTTNIQYGYVTPEPSEPDSQPVNSEVAQERTGTTVQWIPDALRASAVLTTAPSPGCRPKQREPS